MSRGACISLVSGARGILPSALGRAHAHPGGSQQPPRSAASCASRASLGPRRPARASRAPSQHAPPGLPLARAAPLGGGGRGPNSAASPCSSWPPSSPAFWRSSAAPLPGPCWRATPAGARGAGAAGGAKAEGARPRGPQTHTTHTPAGAGLSPHTPSARPPRSHGGGAGGVTCTKYRLQGLARAKFARAGGSGLPRGTRLRERGPCASALLPKRGLAIGEAVVPGYKGLSRQAGRLRVPQRSGRSPGSSDSTQSLLQAGGPSSVPAPKCRQLAALCSYFLRGRQIQLCSTGACSFVHTACVHTCTQAL